ncbi:MAG: D-alanine--D-alanine ligase [Deltaproteobacteria bacterium]|jgi:D-alanine-D-alanine ligase|nr:D-alanine--D-alanine ligase [Deltaproteobacteria bacterium]
MTKKRVVVLMGGRSSEREVSLASGREVLNYLNPDRYAVESLDPATDLSILVSRASEFDVAFPALHGPLGEDGTIQGLLELLFIPYVGSGVLSSALCMDKAATKNVYRNNNLPVADDMVVSKGADPGLSAKKAVEALGAPVVVKPLNQGSSVGLTIASDWAEAAKALGEAWKLYPTALIERYASGRELTVAVLGNRECRALPPIEIVPGDEHKFFDYVAKYTPGQAQEICPARLTPEETSKVSELAVAAHMALNCRGLSRTDFILSEKGEYFLLETNTLPGMTSNSLLPKAAAAAGLPFGELLDELISLALEK